MSDDALSDLSADPTILRPATSAAAQLDDLDFEQTILRTQTGKQVFGRYILARELGRGGMGIVWLAHDKVLETDVALKFLPDSVARDREALVELKRETLRSRELRHSGVVGVYEFVQDAASAAIVMEYIDGLTLSELKTEQPGGCFDVAEIEPWIKQLCDVLTYAHEHARIVHRDLKPRNLMLSASKSLKIADFGIARSVSDSVSRLSMRAHSSGTPPYMSPQQDTGETPSIADDIYAVGATIYDLLTSKPPFYTGNISKQIHEKIPPAMSARRAELGIQGRAAIPDNWERLVAACLAKKPEDRPPSTAACLQWIGSQSVVRLPTKSSARVRRRLVVAAAAAVVLVSGLLFWKATTSKPVQRRQIVSPTDVATTVTKPAITESSPSSADLAMASSPPGNTNGNLSLAVTTPSSMLPSQELPSPSSAPAMASPTPSPNISPPAAKKRVAKKEADGQKSTRQSGSGGSNSSMRSAIEKQYREGNLTREQYLNAIKNN